MRILKPITLFVVLLALMTAGCYTKFYRPGMERAGGPYSSLYTRYDSSAIDTTLMPDTTAQYDQGYPGYQPYYDNWSYWGRPRGMTRWGFDFNHFDPSYYNSYYGYYDYYGVPWWNNWYSPGYPYWGGGSGQPGEPPSRRDVGRREHGDTGGGNVAAPPPANNPPIYAAPTPGNSGGQAQPQSGGEKKRDGKRDR
jgi:hypothetical protein